MDSGAEKQNEQVSSTNPWVWPLDETRYDRTPIFTSAEQETLAAFVQRPRDRMVVVAMAEQQGTLARFLDPLCDALAVTQGEERFKIHSMYLFLRMCARWPSVLGLGARDLDTSPWYLHRQLLRHAQAREPDRLAPIYHRRGLPAQLLQRLPGLGRDRDGEPGVQSLWPRTRRGHHCADPGRQCTVGLQPKSA